MNRSLSENLFHQRAVEVVVSIFSLRRWSQFHANISELLLQSNCWFPASCLNILKCTSDCRLSRTPEIAWVTHILCQMSISFDKQSKLFSSKKNQITYWIKKKKRVRAINIQPSLFQFLLLYRVIIWLSPVMSYPCKIGTHCVKDNWLTRLLC